MASLESERIESTSLFASTAQFYARFRSDVPADVAEIVNRAAPSGSPRRLLDVGTGTGFVIQALLPYFDEAIGVDRDAELLTVASSALAPQVASGQISLIDGTAEEFEVPDGWRAELITVCRAFHWFDRPRFLRRAIDVLAPAGILAVLGDRSVWASNAEWKSVVLGVVREVLGDDRRAGSGTYQRPVHDYSDELVAAGFRDVSRTQVPLRRERSIESVIGYLHSTSFVSMAVLGDRADEFDAVVRERLAPLVDARGMLVDENEFDILIGTRP